MAIGSWEAGEVRRALAEANLVQLVLRLPRFIPLTITATTRTGTWSARAIIHFEPAFEALMLPERHGNEYARSNWLDNPQLAYRNLSREQTIDLIKTMNTTDEIIDIMNPNQSKYFAWNFLSLKTYKTIEFRRGSASLSSNDTFMWVEIVMSFVQAGMYSQQIQNYPKTTGGLMGFLQHAHLPGGEGIHNPAYLVTTFLSEQPSQC